MTLQQIKYALTIAKTGSMNKAAETLFVSQPSLSAAIHELEKEVGIRIFSAQAEVPRPRLREMNFLCMRDRYTSNMSFCATNTARAEGLKENSGFPHSTIPLQ